MTSATPDTSRVPGYSWYALAVLTAVYVLNFLDRTLIYILFMPIKKEMAFSDLQLALLGTTSFVIFYTLLGVPFGLLADRFPRKYIIGGGLAVWSLFSGLTGFADSFWGIFFCRLMVGVGEATLGPAAFSLLGDYFPPRLRATANSIYSSGIALGGGLAFFLGGWIGQVHGWRWAFYLLGFPGLALAVMVFLLRERPRGSTETTTRPSVGWSGLFASRAYWFLCAGYAFVGLAANNLGIWVPTFFVRVHGFSIGTIGTAAGILSLVVGIPAMVSAGWLSDRVARNRMAFTSMIAMASVPLWVGLLFLNNVPLLIAVNVVLYALATMWVGPATADITDIAGPHSRGLAIGIAFSLLNIVAYGLGSPLIGKLSDLLGVSTNAEQMRYSLLVCPIACALGALFLWMGSRVRRVA